MNYDKYISDITKNIKPSGIRKFFDVANSMKDAISLGVGEPDFVTPWSVRDAAILSIKRGYTQYTSNAGMIELREAIGKYLNMRYNLTYDPNDEILVTVGASEGIDIALRALLNPGDEVLIPDPSYVSYSPCVSLCGGVPVPVNCVVENDFKVAPKDLLEKITSKTKVLIMPYPNNPTGAIMEKSHLVEIAKLCIENDIIVISDEIYSELTYDEVHTSIAALDGMRERTIVINGFSKAFAMTGWRLGYVACPREFLQQMYKIHQYGIMCAPTASQYAGIKALNDAFETDFASVKEMHEEYDKRRRYLVKELNNMGLECFEPKGAFYVFPKVSSTGMNGEEFANDLLFTKKIAVVPGSAFGENGNDFVRISYAYSMEKLKKAIKRISEYLEELKNNK